MGRPHIFWKLFGSNPTEPTHRRRGVFVIDELKRRGWPVSTTSADGADVVVLQRSATPAEVNGYKSKDCVVCFDTNDCHIFPGPFFNPAEKEVIARSDFVVTNSRWMRKRYLRINDRTVMIHEALEDEMWAGRDIDAVEKTLGDKLVFSWHGMPDNLQYVEPIIPAFQQFADRIRMVFVMPEKDVHGRSNRERIGGYGVDAELIPWERETWIDHIGNAHVGMAPLPDTEFCRCKGHHKAVGYMALGMPCIMSDVPQYREVVADGENGLIARDVEQWSDAIDRLADASERRRIGAAGMEFSTAFCRESVGQAWDRFLTLIFKEANGG